MSKAPFMIDCPGCMNATIGKKNISTGVVLRVANGMFGVNPKPLVYMDLCDKCGGSGRIAASTNSMGQYGMSLRFTKRHKVEMRKWIDQQKEILYVKAENLG